MLVVGHGEWRGYQLKAQLGGAVEMILAIGDESLNEGSDSGTAAENY